MLLVAAVGFMLLVAAVGFMLRPTLPLVCRSRHRQRGFGLLQLHQQPRSPYCPRYCQVPVRCESWCSARHWRTFRRTLQSRWHPTARLGIAQIDGAARSIDTHASATDPQAMLATDSNREGAKLAYPGRVLMENRTRLALNRELVRQRPAASRIAAAIERKRRGQGGLCDDLDDVGDESGADGEADDAHGSRSEIHANFNKLLSQSRAPTESLSLLNQSFTF